MNYRRLDVLCKEFKDISSKRKIIEEREKEIKEEIIQILNGETNLTTKNFRIKISMIAGKPDTIITPEMVGQVIPGRKSGMRLIIDEI
ncbi:MAG: hypothetical protein NZZ41_06115 [Candidatus Dojkabacteria bacterium]|nr:hypothetical protein [Candidatus Dojkabacteria bacterium]